VHAVSGVTFSLAVKVSVTVSPALARVVSAPLETMCIALIEGGVVSLGGLGADLAEATAGAITARLIKRLASALVIYVYGSIARTGYKLFYLRLNCRPRPGTAYS
jgi:hypothetical protein